MNDTPSVQAARTSTETENNEDDLERNLANDDAPQTEIYQKSS
jgi:hypothetical protein